MPSIYTLSPNFHYHLSNRALSSAVDATFSPAVVSPNYPTVGTALHTTFQVKKDE